MEIIVQQSTNMNRHIARAKREAGVEDCAKAKEAIYAGRQKACELFYDVRTFGAVMSTGPNAGQVRGPVQITFGKSLDPVLPLDISITARYHGYERSASPSSSGTSEETR